MSWNYRDKDPFCARSTKSYHEMRSWSLASLFQFHSQCNFFSCGYITDSILGVLGASDTRWSTSSQPPLPPPPLSQFYLLFLQSISMLSFVTMASFFLYVLTCRCLVHYHHALFMDLISYNKLATLILLEAFDSNHPERIQLNFAVSATFSAHFPVKSSRL